MFKDILLPFLQGEIDEAATRQACLLAERMDGTVNALVAASYFVPATAAWAFYREATYPSLEAAGAAILARYVDKVKERLDAEHIRHTVRGVSEFWRTPSEIVVHHASASDLIVLGVARPLEDMQQKLFAGALAGSGRPILIVPGNAQARAFQHVLVAWKDSREAARALRDAMPILELASTVEVLLVGQEETEASPVGSPARLIQHLRSHGVEGRIARLPRTPVATGWTIADYALSSGADVIVAGGYSHARALQQVFGGVTAHLLKFSPVPVLLSH